MKTTKHIQKQIMDATCAVHLSNDELLDLRMNLVEYIHYKPLRKTPTPHTILNPLTALLPFIRSRHLSGALAIALIVTSSSVGVSYAAVDALPGDFLYTVKVDVNEEIKTAFLTSDEARLEWERERAEKRLEEASQLAAEGRLDSTLTNEVTRRFAEHADAVVAQANVVGETDPFLVAEVTDEFETALDTHEAVLARLSMDQELPPGDGTRNLVEQVHTVANAAEKIRDMAEEQIAADIEVIAATDTETTLITTNISEEDTESISQHKREGDSAHMREQVLFRVESRAKSQLERVELLLAQSDGTAPIIIESRAKIEEGEIKLTEAETLKREGNMSAAYQIYRETAGVFQLVAQLLEVNRMFSIKIPSADDTENSANQSQRPQDHTPGMNVETLRQETSDTITKVRSKLLSIQSLDEPTSERIHTHLKDASASFLRGEIALSLHETDAARKHFRDAEHFTQEAAALIETYSDESQTDLTPSQSNESERENSPSKTEQVTVIEQQNADGTRTLTGSVSGLSCVSLNSSIGTTYDTQGVPVSLALKLISAVIPTESCDHNLDAVQFNATTTASPAPLRIVTIDGIEYAFLTRAHSESNGDSETKNDHDKTTRDATGNTSDAFAHIIDATQEVLLPRP